VHIVKSCCLLLTVLFLALLVGVEVSAQSTATDWTPIRQIPDYDRISRPPRLAAGPDGTVHAFNTQTSDTAGPTITYRRWTLSRGWSNPVDILLAPSIDQGIGVLDVFVDASNLIHMVYYTGVPEGASVYYIATPAETAVSASAWSDSRLIASNGGPLFTGGLVSNAQGDLILVYEGQDDNRLSGNGLYLTHSADGGVTWTSPIAFFLTYDKELWPWSVRLLLDDNDVLHAVWSVTNVRGVGDEIFYSQLVDLQGSWTKPYRLAQREGDDYSANWPAIIADEDELIVVYMDDFPAARFMRRSVDNGQTWGEVERPFPHVGEYENPVLLKDSSGTIHMITGSRIGDPGIHGMWHSTWLGDRWTELMPITSGPRTDYYDPSAPQAVIVQGNLLLASWWNNVPRETLTGAWYTNSLLDAPSVVLSAPVEQSADQTAVARPTGPVVETEAQPSSLAAWTNDRVIGSGNLAIPVYMGIFTALLMVTAVVAITYFRKSKA
jgi:hypothetical protein